MKKNTLLMKFTAIFCIVFLLIPTFSSCTKKSFENTSFAMGSVLSTKIYAKDSKQAEEIFNIINNAVAQADKALSDSDEESEIYRLNKDKAISSSDYLESVLSDAVLICNILGRSVDITIGKVTSLWGFDTDKPSVPNEAELKSALNDVSVEKVLIASEASTVSIDSSVELDMGAFGKGAACDAAYDAAFSQYVPFIMTLGGTVMAYGEGPSNGKWEIGIRDPFGDADTCFATLKLAPDSVKNAVYVSTSGNYEKSFTENGKTYHHIIDPKTGYPVEGDLVSVTVISNSGLNADALSTALFIKGISQDAKDTINAFMCDAIFVTKDKTCYVTDGIKDIIKIKDNSFTVKSINDYTE